jgi:hypothetical protein
VLDRGRGPLSHIFIGDVGPMNVDPYIHRCHVTNEYILNSLVPMNTYDYVRRRYVCWYIRQLIDEFILYSSV